MTVNKDRTRNQLPN